MTDQCVRCGHRQGCHSPAGCLVILNASGDLVWDWVRGWKFCPCPQFIPAVQEAA